ncbi:DUF3035 domain-containing protein [Falsirhodobacter xinxiangensis]|uniref:DUF3035 domain-containing protein n=1 Tax=Falsirhodobacter xinxiangensis TaxID=2530049 RepID=UPI0010A9D2EA|nr:DUF3035 domain-containing protein [Rhodobacter xinxiangensis]
MQAARGALALAGILTLAACGGGDPQLMRVRSDGNGPDAFSVVPSKPLEMPQTLADLPTPTPGGANRTDPNPSADAIVALGGNPNAARSVPAADGAIVAAASRYGREDTRAALATEDLEYRRANPGRFLNRLFNNTTYYQAYEPQSLDQRQELERWRASGRRTPAAPPPAE